MARLLASHTWSTTTYDIKGELKCAACNTVLKFITILYLGDADVRHLKHMHIIGGGGFYSA
jgi:hypothetical protein